MHSRSMKRAKGPNLNIPALLMALVCGMALSVGPVEAHHQRKNSDSTAGIPIPSLTHGQLHIITRYQSAILKLADRQVQPSIEARTLQNFINLQFAYCLWGLVPGSLSSEDNPFNECSHAYLSAAKALLDVLRRTKETQSAAGDLSQEINSAMLMDASSLEICSNSLVPFNTAQIILPEWRSIPVNPLGVVLGLFIFGAALGQLAIARSNRRSFAT